MMKKSDGERNIPQPHKRVQTVIEVILRNVAALYAFVLVLPSA